MTELHTFYFNGQRHELAEEIGEAVQEHIRGTFLDAYDAEQIAGWILEYLETGEIAPDPM